MEWRNEQDKPSKFNDKGRFRGFFGTWNNYTEEDYDYMCKLETTHKVIGKEVGESGTPHLQFCLYWENAKTFSAMVKICKKKAHIEIAHKYENCVKYCKKEGNFFEDGELPRKVSVNNWNEIQEDIKSGMEWKDLVSKYPQEAIMYSTGLRNHYETLKPKHEFSIIDKYGSFLDWQRDLLRDTEGDAPDRTIIWYVDTVGGKGKTDMAIHMVSNLGWLRLTNGKTADIALTWNGQNVVFDYSRSQAEYINYGVLEDLKNGAIFSGKYQSVSKIYARPWVVVFANFAP
ncbi:MAG: hypothetical protein H7836_17145, partial [Magnetococcus sp. YQC-3]